MPCERCGDSGWVSEAHDELAWQIEGESHCGAPGVPCPDCNPSSGRDDPPDDSRIFAVIFVRRDPWSGDAMSLALRASWTAYRGIEMPTNLPARPSRPSHAFALFAALIALSLFAIEIIDPAPMGSQAASIASP